MRSATTPRYSSGSSGSELGPSRSHGPPTKEHTKSITSYAVELKVSWTDAESVTMGPDDSFYFPPGREYTVENAAIDDVFLVWSVVPSPGFVEDS